MKSVMRVMGLAAGVVVTAVVGALSTEPESRWYRRLRKPEWQPPQRAFPIVWTSLYAGIVLTSAAVLHRLRRRGQDREAGRYRRTLALNLVLNAAWSIIFWRGRSLPAATAEAAVLTVSTAALTRRAGAASPLLAISLLPYLAWSAFATGLAATLDRLNPRRHR